MNNPIMRKRWLGLAAGLSLLPLAAPALADDAGRVYYKDGTTIETKDARLQMNFLVQPNFSYTDVDTKGAADLGIIDDTQDTTSFDLGTVRAAFSGDLLNKQFSFMIYDDLRSDHGGSQLQDAWLQWNSDQANVRLGQTNVPFSRSELAADHGLQMIERPFVSDLFSPARQIGALVHGPVADGVTYAVGAFNGNSDDEGINTAGQDNKLLYAAQVTASTPGYGSRVMEGDMRTDNKGFDLTGGVAVYYSGNESTTLGQTDDFGLNVDLGTKLAGWSTQTEFYYQNLDPDDAGSSLDNWGFYVQSGYMMNKQWELAGRFSYFEPDSDLLDVDVEEYALVVNYFLNGHNLKLQTGVTWVDGNFGDSDSDITDFQFKTQLTGYL